MERARVKGLRCRFCSAMTLRDDSAVMGMAPCLALAGLVRRKLWSLTACSGADATTLAPDATTFLRLSAVESRLRLLSVFLKLSAVESKLRLLASVAVWNMSRMEGAESKP